MSKEIVYNTAGTCCRQIIVRLDDNDIVEHVQFIGGCNGNTQGVGALCKGMSAKEVIERLKGIKCGGKMTSCPEQLAIALENQR